MTTFRNDHYHNSPFQIQTNKKDNETFLHHRFSNHSLSLATFFVRLRDKAVLAEGEKLERPVRIGILIGRFFGLNISYYRFLERSEDNRIAR